MIERMAIPDFMAANPKLAIATDVELAGDVLRVAIAGLPEISSHDANEALSELRLKHDQFRDFLNLPPNGNRLINSCLLYPPFEQGTDGTLFLASRFAYAPYAGTALMAAATVLTETQATERDNGKRHVCLLTARGLMKVTVEWTDNSVTRAKWLTTPPKVLVSNVELRLNASLTVPVDVVDAGLPYLVVDAGKMGLAIDDYSGLSKAAIALSAATGTQYPLSLFGIAENYDHYLVMFTTQVAGAHFKTVWVSDQGAVAQSAGGTGALAVLAACESNGVVKPGRTTLIEAPGGAFECQIEETRASVASTVMIIARHEFRLAGQ